MWRLTLLKNEEAFLGIVVEGLRHLFGWQQLFGPGEGRVVAPVSSELLRADLCPVWVCKFSNCDHTQLDSDPVDLAEFVVTHPFLLPHFAEDLHK